MTKVIALANQKGGVGKTTTAVNLGIGLARQNKKVLLIDADSQGNLTDALGRKQTDNFEVTLTTLLKKVIDENPIEAGEGILHHAEGTDLVPSNIELSALEMTLFNTMRREYAVADYLRIVKRGYDYVLIDCSPSLGMITVNALVAADSVIIPVQSHYLEAMQEQDCTPSFSQSVRLKGLLNEGKLTNEAIFNMLMEPKANQREKVTFQYERLRKYFPRCTPQQMEETDHRPV